MSGIFEFVTNESISVVRLKAAISRLKLIRKKRMIERKLVFFLIVILGSSVASNTNMICKTKIVLTIKCANEGNKSDEA